MPVGGPVAVRDGPARGQPRSPRLGEAPFIRSRTKTRAMSMSDTFPSRALRSSVKQEAAELLGGGLEPIAPEPVVGEPALLDDRHEAERSWARWCLTVGFESSRSWAISVR